MSSPSSVDVASAEATFPKHQDLSEDSLSPHGGCISHSASTEPIVRPQASFNKGEFHGPQILGGTGTSPEDGQIDDGSIRDRRDGVVNTKRMSAMEVPPAANDLFLSRTRVALIICAFGLGGFLTSLDAVMVSTALPAIQRDLSVTSSKYSWIGSAYLLAGASVLCLWGPISDVVGRKWVLVAGMATFVLGNIIAALAPSGEVLIAGRAVQGVGGFAYVVLLNVALADMFSLRERGMYIAIYAMSSAVGAAMGPIFSGLLSGHIGWRYCFWIMLPFASVSLIMTMACFPATLPRRRSNLHDLRHLDWPGVMLITAGTILVLLGLQCGGISHPWTSVLVLATLIGGSLAMIVFVIEQALVRRPIMPLRLFNDRSRAACFTVCFSHGFVYIGCIYYLPVYFSLVLDASPAQAGLWLLTVALPCAFFAGLVSWSVKKTGYYRLVISISTATLAAACGLFIDFPTHRSFSRIIVYQLVLSVGIGSLLQVPSLALQASVKAEEVTAANATFIFVRTLSSAISIVVGQVVLQNEMKSRANDLLSAGVAPGLIAGMRTQLDSFKTAPGITVAQEQAIKVALTTSLSRVWILYCAVAGLGFLASLGIEHRELSAGGGASVVGEEEP